MIAYLEELLAKLFGAQDAIAIPVRAKERSAKEKLMKGRK